MMTEEVLQASNGASSGVQVTYLEESPDRPETRCVFSTLEQMQHQQ